MKTTFKRRRLYYFHEALKSIRRNGFLSLATVMTVMVSLFMLGAVVLLILNGSNYLSGLEDNVEISAFVEKSYTDEQALELRGQLEALNGVEEVIFVSRQEAMASMQSRYSNSGYDLEQTLESNPLPNSYRIKATDPHNVEDIAQMVGRMGGFYRVNYGQDIAEKLFSLTRSLRWVGCGVIIMIIISAIFLIGINIRLSIFSRRKEIYLMKLIGARDSFITRPFYLEGIFLAITGAVIAVLLLFSGYGFVLQEWAGTTYEMIFPLLSDQQLLLKCYGGLLGVGLILGWLGTAISVRRFMDV